MLAAAVGILISSLLHMFQDRLVDIGGWAYPAALLLEGVASAAYFFPIPAHTYTYTAASGVNPIALGFLAALGSTVGETAAFLLGRRRHRVIKRGRARDAFRRAATAMQGRELFLLALIPLPIAVTGVWTGTFRYPVRKFAIRTFVGRLVLLLGIALAGSFFG